MIDFSKNFINGSILQELRPQIHAFPHHADQIPNAVLLETKRLALA